LNCNIHKEFFDWGCNLCKEEYKEFKGGAITRQGKKIDKADSKHYKEFTEDKAKELFEEIFLQYIKKGTMNEIESRNRSKSIIKKQCQIRGIKPWSWLE
jgi:hypothetical protein